MFRMLIAATLLMSGPVWADIHQTSAGPVKVEAIVDDLDTPWSVAFLPDGRLLITERDGNLLVVSAGGEKRRVARVPEVRAQGQGGLFDIVPDPNYAQNKICLLYTSDAADD